MNKKMNKFAAIFGALAIAGAALAAPAQASNASWICDVLSAQPNKAGVSAVIGELISEGYTADNGGPELFANTVITECPELIPAVRQAVDQLA